MTRFRSGLCLVVACWALPSLRSEDKRDFFFHDGDRILFLGDSITEQYQYSTDIELYLTLHFPKWRLTFLNAGISGDTAAGGAGRFARHVLAEKPTAVTIDFGMNDGGYGPFIPQKQANYLKRTEQMLQDARKAGIRVALISPNAVDHRVKPKQAPDRFKIYQETQKEFYAPLKELAAKYDVPFIDQYAITRAGMEKMEADHADAVKPFTDGVHTSTAGGWFMANTILVGLHKLRQGMADHSVSTATIRLPNVPTSSQDQSLDHSCAISNVKETKDGVEFDRLDEALPVPVQSDWVSLLPYVNGLRDMNWYGLRAVGPKGGKYTVKIDKADVGVSFSNKELEEGVNLGNLTKGPLHDQGMRVLAAINAKNKLVQQRFRGVVMRRQWANEEERQKELDRRMKIIDEKQAEIYKMAQPAPHHFELTLAK
jgi:lysophospholipase L1-like esterase